MSDRDYYEILGLTPGADGPMVDQAYWHLARKYQQLSATNSHAQHLLDELNESYGVVGNPRLRAQYDAFRDDVLVRQGMIQPVAAQGRKPRRRKPEAQDEAASPKGSRAAGGGFSLPAISQEQRRAYLVAAIIAALGIAGAWQGVNILFVATALVAGLAYSLVPTIRHHLPEMNVQLPSMPSIHAPHLGMPNLGDINMPVLREQFGFGQKDEPLDADELRASTATTIARWRRSVGLNAPDSIAQLDSPDTTLVDIFEVERQIDETDEPLAAVIDILRGSRSGGDGR